MNKISNQFSSIEQITDRYLGKDSHNKGIEGKASIGKGSTFEEVLIRTQAGSGSKVEGHSVDTMQTAELKFSKHAAMRLENRNIELSQEQKERLQIGTERAQEKGIKEGLVVVDSLAFIVNVPNKTVVTAMEQGENNSNIYTNIDGAVFM